MPKSGPKELAAYHAKVLEREQYGRRNSAKSKVETSSGMASADSDSEVVLVGQLPSDDGSGTCGMASVDILPRPESDMGRNQAGQIRSLPARCNDGDDSSADERICEPAQLLFPPAPNTERKREPAMNFKEQARASIEHLDAEQMEAAQRRVDAILGTQAGPTLIPQQETQPQAPATRKTRKDKGVPKKAPADPDEIVLKLSLHDARVLAIDAGATGDEALARKVHDQIIAQLQKRIDQLQKSAPK